MTKYVLAAFFLLVMPTPVLAEDLTFQVQPQHEIVGAWSDSAKMTGSFIPMETIAFYFDSEKAMLTIHRDGRVEWTGDQSGAVRAFWRLVEEIGGREFFQCRSATGPAPNAIATP